MMSKQSIMNKEFVPYTESSELEQLGFDEFCFAWYVSENYGLEFGGVVKDELIRDAVLAPTFSQAFRFFREKYWYTVLILCDSFQIVQQLSTSKTLDFKTGEFLPVYITQTFHKEEGLKSYDESELACLKKLIEIQKGLESQQ